MIVIYCLFAIFEIKKLDKKIIEAPIIVDMSGVSLKKINAKIEIMGNLRKS